MFKTLSIVLFSLVLGACQTTPMVSDSEFGTEEDNIVVTQPVNDDVNHFLVAKEAYSNKDYDLARQEYEVIIKDHPRYTEALFRLGNIAMRDNKLEKAQEYYNRVTRIKPAHAQAHHNLAILYLKQANKHLNYYVANDDKSDNQAISKLLRALDRYADSRSSTKSELDALADLVTAE